MLTMKPTRLAACLFAATLPQLGCQFIFGINEYETGEGAGAANPSSSGGNAGENAGGSGLGGRGGSGPGPGSGGGGEGGSGGSCSCTDGNEWTYISAPIIAELGSEPTSCGGNPRINLHFGEPELTCSACSAVIDSGSCSSTLSCFNSTGSCSENQGAPAVSTNCQNILDFGELLPDSCSATAPTSPGCNPGTSNLQGEPSLGQVLSFCQGCGADCNEIVCAVHDAAETICPNGLTEAYLLRDAATGNAACDECTASPSCLPSFYVAEPFGNCDIPVSGCVTNVAKVRRAEVSTNCNSNHAEPYAPTFEPSGTLRTVCCSASLDPALDAYRLP
jgi:hypothetical protein